LPTEENVAHEGLVSEDEPETVTRTAFHAQDEDLMTEDRHTEDLRRHHRPLAHPR
jgi:hypothetical protein